MRKPWMLKKKKKRFFLNMPKPSLANADEDEMEEVVEVSSTRKEEASPQLAVIIHKIDKATTRDNQDISIMLKQSRRAKLDRHCSD